MKRFSMQKSSSDSVKINYFNYPEIFGQLKSAVTDLKSSNQNVKQVILFGSLAGKNYGPGSDADLLIILRKDSRRKMDRIPEFLMAFSAVSVPVDVIPITEAELQKAIHEDNLFYRRILKEGIEL